MTAAQEKNKKTAIEKLLGQSEKHIRIAIKVDESGWLESDYQEARMMLETLEEGNTEQYQRFLSEWKAVSNKNKLSLQQKCQVVQFLLSSFMNWRQTGVATLRTQSGAITIVFEEVKSGTPQVTLSFQQVVDQIIQFDPPPDSVDTWSEVFARALRRPESPPEGFRPIVQGSSTRRKPGRKPRS